MPRAKPHVRAFIVDSHGAPAAHVDVVATAETRDGRRIQLGVLRSDHAGYVSFNAEILGSEADVTRLRIYPRLEERSAVDLDVRAITDDPEAPPVIVVAGRSGERPRGPVIPSIQDPSAFDWRVSPGSLATNPSLTLGSGACEVLVPGNHATYEFGYRQLVRATEWEDAVAPRNRRIRVHAGFVDEFRISWYPLGHSLGQLVYSLPLAPCESVNIAVVEWSRTDRADRAEDLLVGEQLVHFQRRDRTISETVEAALRELQQGGSVMGGVAGSALIKGVIPVVASVGGGYFASSGGRDVTAATVQTVADQIVQSSSSVRQLSSTVVVEAAQAERDVVQTRTVANHNHCHALTVLYYEVLRHYRVVTEWVGRQEILLIGYDVRDFTRDDLGCHTESIRRAMIDPNLAGGLDAARRLATGATVMTPPPPARTIDMLIVHTGTGSDGTNGDVFLRVQLDDGTTRRWRLDDPNSDNFEPDRNERFAIGRGRLGSLAIDRITMIGIEIRPTPGIGPIEIGDPWLLASLRVEYVLTGQPGVHVLFEDPGLDQQFQGRDEWWTSVTPPLSGTTVNPIDTTESDEALESSLLRHLNCNRLRYWSAIWFDEDPNERAYRLDAYQYRGAGLLDAIANAPVGLLGNYMAFPSNIPSRADDADDPIPPAERVISLPTRGVFAEAQLSHCNACEERDITRFWDWSESPCAPPPAITGIQPGSRAQQQDLQSSQMPAPVTTIVNAPAAPDPTGMAAALSLLGTPGIFRDMSNAQGVTSLIRDLAAGAVSMDNARQRAAQIQEQVRRVTGSGSGGGGGSGDVRQPSPREQHDRLQIWRDAERKNEATRERHNARVEDYLSNPGGVTLASWTREEDEGGGGGTTGSTSSALGASWVREVEESGVWEDFLEELAEEVLGELPLATYLFHARDFGVAFGEGVEKGIVAARRGMGSIYDGITGPELTQADIDRFRQRGVVLMEQLAETLRLGVQGMLEELETKLINAGLSQFTEPIFKRAADRIGDFMGDILTGDYAPWFDFISQEGEDAVQALGRDLGGAIAAAVQEDAVEAGLEALRDQGLTPLQILEQLQGAGVSDQVVVDHLAGLSLDDVVTSIQAKIDDGALRGAEWQGSIDNYLLALDAVRTLVARYETLTLPSFSTEGQALNQEIAAALSKLSGMIDVLRFAFKLEPKYGIDVESEAVRRMGEETFGSRSPVLELD